MKQDFEISGETTHIPKNTGQMLRGYDPLQEVYRWHLLSLLCLSELLCVGLASFPIYSSAFFLVDATIWGIHPGTLVPFLLLLGIFLFLWVYTYYRAEKLARTKLRLEALMLDYPGQALDQAQTHPSSAFQKLLLPMQIESRRSRFFTLRITIGLFLLLLSLIANYALILTQPSEPHLLYVLPPLLAIIIIGLSIGIFMGMRLRIVGYYLLPALTIDDKAITASYGRVTITIAWHDIRSFALVNSSLFRQLPTAEYPPTFRQALKAGILSPGTPAPEHEAFEISDGENVICWLKATPFRHHRLLRFGEVALSDQDYAAFTQQLAALIMEKTNLPLYDLRIGLLGPPEKFTTLSPQIAPEAV